MYNIASTMLEKVDLSQKLSAKQFKKSLPALQNRLRELQQQIRLAHIPVVLVFEGWDLTGKGGIVRMISERLDPRGAHSYPIYPATAQESEYPFMRRFWLRLPSRGEIIIFYHSWYGRVLGDRVEKRCSKKEWKSAYQEINEFERQLVDDGALILKYWLHFSKKDQKKRLVKYAKDPFEKWQISPEVKKRQKKYGKYLAAVEEMLERTNTTHAPWAVIPARDSDLAAERVFHHVIAALEGALQKAAKSTGRISDIRERKVSDNRLRSADLDKDLTEDQYEKSLNKYQHDLRRLQFKIQEKKHSVILVYEGWDAAGKGGNIRRLTAKLDPRWVEVHPIAAPSKEEKGHHYLWRFWKRIPHAGMFSIFDRSWYGRVLVERVESFATHQEWSRAYKEIREFERHLTNSGVILIKFWLHISRKEQLRRFNERQKLDYKNYKITDEDWRNRKKWDDYFKAVSEMIRRTSTDKAPWVIVEGNSKRWARVKTLRSVVNHIKDHL
jgi:polyphosphate:AMP phosphotransferase